MHAVFAMVATTVETMTALEHTDPAFAADAPPLSATEPALAFVGASRGRFRATTRQHHAADTAIRRGLFVGRRAEAAIGGRQIRGAPEDGLVAIQRGGPQRDVGRAFRVDVVRRDDPDVTQTRFMNVSLNQSRSSTHAARFRAFQG